MPKMLGLHRLLACLIFGVWQEPAFASIAAPSELSLASVMARTWQGYYRYNGSALAMSYDNLDRVTQVVQTLPNSYSATIGYAFDANGNRTRMTLSLGGQTFNFSYVYDALDRVTSITNPYSQTITFAYDAVGRRKTMGYPNGITASYAYDAADQVTQVLHRRTADQTAVAFTNYTYDVAGNVTGTTDINGAHTFGYDQLDQLTSASHAGTSTLPIKAETFTHDAIGNRTSDAVRTGYVYNAANRITGDSRYTYTSDANGNITSRTDRTTHETTTFVYDSAGQLIEVVGPSGTIATYKYDPAGNRIDRNVGGTIFRYVYDKGRPLAILDASNSLVALYTEGPGIDAPLIVHQGGVDYFFHADALGNITALTDTSGNIVETYEYQAFGRAVIKDAQGGLHDRSTVGNPYLYAGRELDPETGLYHFRARTYEPDTGRFLQEDPLLSVNQYAYAFNSPLMFSDPLGLSAVQNALNIAAGCGSGTTSGLVAGLSFGLASWNGTNPGSGVDPCSTSFSIAYTACKINGFVLGSLATWKAIQWGVGRAWAAYERWAAAGRVEEEVAISARTPVGHRGKVIDVPERTNLNFHQGVIR